MNNKSFAGLGALILVLAVGLIALYEITNSNKRANAVLLPTIQPTETNYIPPVSVKVALSTKSDLVIDQLEQIAKTNGFDQAVILRYYPSENSTAPWRGFWSQDGLDTPGERGIRISFPTPLHSLFSWDVQLDLFAGGYPEWFYDEECRYVLYWKSNSVLYVELLGCEGISQIPLDELPLVLTVKIDLAYCEGTPDNYMCSRDDFDTHVDTNGILVTVSNSFLPKHRIWLDKLLEVENIEAQLPAELHAGTSYFFER